MSSEAPQQKTRASGAPAWVVTFADLMSLLMCFFVLLLAFSEMDVSKYKEMAGSLKNAFGVQREIQVKEPPKGINVIAREFSPARPEPTPLNVIRQMTTSDKRVNLDLGKERRRPVPTPRAEREPDREASLKPAVTPPSQEQGLTELQKQELARAKQLAAQRLEQKLAAGQRPAQRQSAQVDQTSVEERAKARVAAERQKRLQHSAKLISNALGREIKAGSVDVETAGQKIIIRVREKASFGSGRAELKGAFRPILKRVANILKGSEGQIIVAGHTDNLPIYTERFRSNWELSAARAVSVAHEMMLATDIPSERFLVQGFADTQPVAGNDTAANRARNRRVEIVLQQGDDRESSAPAISGQAPGKEQPSGLRSQSRPQAAVAKPPAAGAAASRSAPRAKERSAPKTPAALGIRVGGSK